MTDREQFDSQIVPVMDRVREEMQRKQADEVRRHMRSPASILASGIGPDGGMGAQAMALDTLNIIGEWGPKTVEDYVAMVKEELLKGNISVSPEMEELMIDKMVRDQMPKSSVEYVIRKAGSNTVFGLVNELRKSPLQREIDERGEALHGPSKLEKGIGWAVGAAADLAAFGGFSGGFANGLKFVGADLAINAAIEGVENKHKSIPSVIFPEYADEWLEASQNQQKKASSQTEEDTLLEGRGISGQSESDKQVIPDSTEDKQDNKAEANVVHDEAGRRAQEEVVPPAVSNSNGWQGILTGLGLNGISDIGRNAGYILAMLPDILVGLFTGKTTSFSLKDNLMPVASIMAGLFVKNPLLKMTLIGLGGANLINKVGHEQLDKHESAALASIRAVRYRQYEEEVISPRIKDAQISGNTLIASIDNIPVTISLPDKVVEAYAQGAIPLGTLANAILSRCDQMQQLTDARQRFEEETREVGRTLSQR